MDGTGQGPSACSIPGPPFKAARYRCEHVTGPASMEDFLSEAALSPGAIGEEIAGFFRFRHQLYADGGTPCRHAVLMLRRHARATGWK